MDEAEIGLVEVEIKMSQNGNDKGINEEVDGTPKLSSSPPTPLNLTPTPSLGNCELPFSPAPSSPAPPLEEMDSPSPLTPFNDTKPLPSSPLMRALFDTSTTSASGYISEGDNSPAVSGIDCCEPDSDASTEPATSSPTRVDLIKATVCSNEKRLRMVEFRVLTIERRLSELIEYLNREHAPKRDIVTSKVNMWDICGTYVGYSKKISFKY